VTWSWGAATAVPALRPTKSSAVAAAANGRLIDFILPLPSVLSAPSRFACEEHVALRRLEVDGRLRHPCRSQPVERQIASSASVDRAPLNIRTLSPWVDDPSDRQLHRTAYFLGGTCPRRLGPRQTIWRRYRRSCYGRFNLDDTWTRSWPRRNWWPRLTRKAFAPLRPPAYLPSAALGGGAGSFLRGSRSVRPPKVVQPRPAGALWLFRTSRGRAVRVLVRAINRGLPELLVRPTCEVAHDLVSAPT